MASITAPDLEAIKARQQATWASGDYSAVGASDPHHLRAAVRLGRPPRGLEGARRRRRKREHGARRRTLRLRGRLGRLRPLAARAGARARRGRRPRGGDRGGRRGGPPLPRRLVRRGRVGGRRDVRARPRARGRRAPARLPARRHDRAGQLDAGRLHRRAVHDHRPARPSPGGADAAAPVGNRGARPDAPRRRRADADGHAPELHVPLSLPAALRGVLPGALRAHAQGLRRPRRGRQRALAQDLADLVRRYDRLGGDGPVAVPADYLEVVATRTG